MHLNFQVLVPKNTKDQIFSDFFLCHFSQGFSLLNTKVNVKLHVAYIIVQYEEL